MNGRSTKKIRGLSALAPVLAAAALGGCAGAFEADATASPIAEQVQALVDANRTYPRWSEFPRTSTDTPSAAVVGARVAALGRADGALRDETARIHWRLGDPVAFESDVRARLAAVRVSPAAQKTEAEIEAYAEQLRRRGEAPPPIPRRP